MIIKRYSTVDEIPLFDMLREEGDEWSDYYGVKGYARCREDDGFGVYVYDLLVRKNHRGKQIGKMLMEEACKDFSDQPVYLMSDVDVYYEKLGYRREGSIFEVKR